jgi:sugar transferase (PEP-CTERM/EpsH1 system associated)
VRRELGLFRSRVPLPYLGHQLNTTRPPLIAHAIHHLVIGGMENGLVNLINRIPADRYRHMVLCAEDYSDFRDRIARPDVAVLALKKSTASRGAMFRRLRDLFDEHRPAIVHGRNLSGLDALFPAWRAGVRARIQGEHGWDVADIDGSRLRPRLLRRLHSPLVTQYVTVSKHLASYLTARIGIAPRRITQIYNGVDTDRFVPASEKPSGLLPTAFCGDDKVVVGTVGRLQAVKDQASLIRACAILLRETPSLRNTLRVVIVGDGPQRDALNACASEEGVADVVWMPGARRDVDVMYRAFDAFVLPSLNEGISNTLLEAMASRLPIIATAVGGNVELVHAGMSGQLVPAANAPALAAAIRTYVEDPVLRRRHGAESRARATANFSIDSMVGSYLDLYDRAIQRSR